MKILIVDDDEIFLDKLKKILVLNQHAISTAISGEQALLQINHDKFDLILTDLKMPGLTGMDLIKKIREKEISSMIIVITGYGTIESAIEAMKAGAYDYILKPFEMSTLDSKIKEVENELKLRKDLTAPENENKSETEDISELKKIHEYKAPFLVISDEKPDEIIKYLKLPDAIAIQIKFNEEDGTIIPTKLYSLKFKIEDFIKKSNEGTIILKGIEELLKAHQWETLKKFISYLQSEIITSKFSLIILVKKDIEFLNNSHQSILHDALSFLINPIFDKIINLLSHPIRKNIIILLKTELNLNYNKILGMLDVERSSVLAFHLNKLMNEGIIKKDSNMYSLSAKGLFFANMIAQIENFGFSYPQSNIKIFKMPSIPIK